MKSVVTIEVEFEHDSDLSVEQISKTIIAPMVEAIHTACVLDGGPWKVQRYRVTKDIVEGYFRKHL